MKFAINFKSTLILIVFTSLIFSSIIKCTETTNQNEALSFNSYGEEEQSLPKETRESAKEFAKSYIYFAKLPYCTDQKTCEACKQIQSKGFKLISSEKTKSGMAEISMTINRNPEKKETVISFAGPRSKDLNFIQSIYVNGFSAEAEKALNSPIENVFWEAYTAIKPKLLKQITEIFASSEEENVIFVGHSFGGSLAILAAYDLKKTDVINKSHKSKVITFAALKIGNIGFLKALHTLIPIGVVRLRSIFDLFPFIPRCVYIPSLNVFHCYTSYVNLVRVWPIFARYIYTYYPIIRSKIAWAAPGVIKTTGGLKALAAMPTKAATPAKSIKPNVASKRAVQKPKSRSSSLNKKLLPPGSPLNKKTVKTIKTIKRHNKAFNKHLTKALKHGKISSTSRMSMLAGIKSSTTDSSLLSKVNKSSKIYKKLMNKSIGKSKALKLKKFKKSKVFKRVILIN